MVVHVCDPISLPCLYYCLDLFFKTDLYSFLTHYVAKACLNPDPPALLSQCGMTNMHHYDQLISVLGKLRLEEYCEFKVSLAT